MKELPYLQNHGELSSQSNAHVYVLETFVPTALAVQHLLIELMVLVWKDLL